MQRNGADSKAKMPSAYITGSIESCAYAHDFLDEELNFPCLRPLSFIFDEK
jgi:hypothetical protein